MGYEGGIQLGLKIGHGILVDGVAAKDPEVYRQWKDAMSHTMMFMEPDLRERLLRRHDDVGPIAQRRDLVTIDACDVSYRIDSLQPPLLLIRGVDDPGQPPGVRAGNPSSRARFPLPEAGQRRAFPNGRAARRR